MKLRKYIFRGEAVGWLWFDKRQIKRFEAGYFTVETNHAGELENDYKLWWSLFGFCGYFPINCKLMFKGERHG